jgi:hypothetical protein
MSAPSIKQSWRNAMDIYVSRNRLETVREPINVEKIKISNSLSLNICGTKAQKERIAKIAKDISFLPKGRKNLIKASKSNMVIVPVNGMGGYGSYMEDKKVLCLNSKSSDDKLLATLAHEARHACQFETGFQLSEASLTPKSYLMGVCAIEADASSMAAMVAWELKERGQPVAWKNYEETYPTLAKALKENSSEQDIKSGKAQMSVFKAWYQNYDTRRIYENNYPLRLKNTPNLSLDKELSSKELVKLICNDENGKSYFKENPNILESKHFLSVEEETLSEISSVISRSSSINEKNKEKILNQVPKRKICVTNTNYNSNQNLLSNIINNKARG